MPPKIPEVEYLYILFGDEWPVRRTRPISTSSPAARGDTIYLALRSDVDDHAVHLCVAEVIHNQAIDASGAVDAGCQLRCEVLRHAAEPIGTMGLLREQAGGEFFLDPPPRRRKPRLRVIDP